MLNAQDMATLSRPARPGGFSRGGAVLGAAAPLSDLTRKSASAVVQSAIAMLLAEIRRTGSLSPLSMAWVQRNTDNLATADVQRLLDAVSSAQTQLARGVSLGGALVK